MASNDGQGQPAATPPKQGSLELTAARGVGLLVGRTLGLQLVTLGVTVVLARLLSPADYGLFALALAVQLVGQRFAELGLPSSLIRQPEEPSPAEQAAVGGLMVAIGGGLSLAALGVAFGLLPALSADSRTVEVVAIALLGMPFFSFRAIPLALLERQMRFGRVAIVETADNLAFNLFALLAAIAGAGAFSLAGAVPVGALAGALAAIRVQPFNKRLRLDLGLISPLLSFGLKVTTLQGLHLVRELSFVSVLAAVGGVSLAGFYAMGRRMFSFPIALTSAIFRVSFPALSRDNDLRAGRAVRMLGLSGVVAGLPLALVAGAAGPAVAILLGDRWTPVTDIVLIGSLGMMVTVSALTTLTSFALANGKPGVPIVSAGVEIVVLLVIAVVLFNPLGEAGVGIAITAGSIASLAVLLSRTDTLLREAMPLVVKTTAIAIVAALAGHFLPVEPDLPGLLASLATVAAVWFALELLLSKTELLSTLRLARPLIALRTAR